MCPLSIAESPAGTSRARASSISIADRTSRAPSTSISIQNRTSGARTFQIRSRPSTSRAQTFQIRSPSTTSCARIFRNRCREGTRCARADRFRCDRGTQRALPHRIRYDRGTQRASVNRFRSPGAHEVLQTSSGFHARARSQTLTGSPANKNATRSREKTRLPVPKRDCQYATLEVGVLFGSGGASAALTVKKGDRCPPNPLANSISSSKSSGS